GIFPHSSTSSASSGLFAVSGSDGRVLWHSQLDLGSYSLVHPMATAAPPDGDLDGDGLADVVLFTQPLWTASDRQSPLRAFSGKTGRRLWEAQDLRVREGEDIQFAHLLECHDLDGDGRPEVLFAYRRSRHQRGPMFLAVLSGGDGKLRWEQPISA